MVRKEKVYAAVSSVAWNWECPYCSYIAESSCFLKTKPKTRLMIHIALNHALTNWLFRKNSGFLKFCKKTEYQELKQHITLLEALPS